MESARPTNGCSGSRTPDVWYETMRINLDGPFHLSRLLLRGMVERNYGRVVYTSSTAGRVAELAGSAYNERRTQCEEGVRRLQAVLPRITALRDVSSAQLEAHKRLLPETIYRRCRHVVSENERVHAAVDAFERGDYQVVGQLMNESHTSLRDDYEVSSEALDVMVDAMRSQPGCLGARLTGAGFGGCAVALVRTGTEAGVREAIRKIYARKMNLWPEVYISAPSSGARVLPLT